MVKKKVNNLEDPDFQEWLWNMYYEARHKELVEIVINKMTKKKLEEYYKEYKYQKTEEEEDSKAEIASEKIRVFDFITTFTYYDIKTWRNKTLNEKKIYIKDLLKKELEKLKDVYNEKSVKEIGKDVLKKIKQLK